MPKRLTVLTTYKKSPIPRALREQVWIQFSEKQFEIKCIVSWCNNRINAFDFHVGHNVPESKGGKTNISNLRPICSRCNLSMGNKYSIDEWNKISKGALETPHTEAPHTEVPQKNCLFCCF